jgi:hypothetical protein
MPMTKQIEELIHRRRRQILVHSIIYYHLNENIVPDAVFDAWAKELAALQDANLQLSESIPYMRYAFADWTGETGAFLPLMDRRAGKVAAELLETYKNSLTLPLS